MFVCHKFISLTLICIYIISWIKPIRGGIINKKGKKKHPLLREGVFIKYVRHHYKEIYYAGARALAYGEKRIGKCCISSTTLLYDIKYRNLIRGDSFLVISYCQHSAPVYDKQVAERATT
jgi:hypothetical protein